MRCVLLACLAMTLIAGGCASSEHESSRRGPERLTKHPKVVAMQAVIAAEQRRLLREGGAGVTRVDHTVTIGDRAPGGDFVHLTGGVGRHGQTTSYDISFSPASHATRVILIETVDQPPGVQRITERHYAWVADRWVEQASPTTSPVTPGE